ncbi:uncharacterized protein CG7065-like isoform X2 [Atheta coriaria]|uniref:uncharacterized protein CG7065-like isoform X2 n=1 Tax=Dalotia coriaria TaxID=877792 RepID=UPI0031F438AF
MESLAPPGTEDNITSPASSTYISKKNSETDRLLSLRYTLPDGSSSAIFELTWQNGSEVWYCRVCHCPVMGQVFNHEAGKRHVAALEAASASRNQRTSASNLLKSTSNSNSADWDDGNSTKNYTEQRGEVIVAPGEPVPPGFEGEITKVAQIQERLDNFKTTSLIGLEYLLELQDYDQEREPSYFCLLCGKKGDFRTIIPHLVSYNHLQYYLQRHYTKTYNALVPFSSHKKYKKCWQEALTKIADAIETKYGRMLPHPIDMDTYERNKQEVYNKVNNGPHFSESNGVSFEHLVNRDEIINNSNKDELNQDAKPAHSRPTSRDNEPKHRRNRRSLSSVSSISSDDFTVSVNDRDRNRSSKPVKSNTSSLYNRRRRTRTRSRSRSPYRRRAEDSLPWNRPDYRRNENNSSKDRRSKEDDRDNKKDEFRRLAAAIEKDMEPQLRKHQMNPEKHPQYNEEWKIFWNKRYKELQMEGRDTQGYDFKPEWIVYWNKRMEEFHKTAVKQSIDALRRRLGLAEVTPISFKINSASTSSSAMRRRDPKFGCQPVAAQPDQDHEVIVIDDLRDDKVKSREDSHSPWESDSNNSPRKDYRRRPAPLRRTTKTRSRSKSRSRSLSPYRRRNYGRRRTKSRSRSRSKSRRYRRTTRSKSKSPQIRREADSSKTTGGRRSVEWDRAVSYKNHQQANIPFAPSGKDVIMVRESALKKQEILDEQITAVEDLGVDVNIVAVLRLLTALEDKLGSLGPKVVDLLAKALSMEKKTPNSSEQLLDDETNCVMFETIKEKLKGLLHAGLVADYPSQEKAVKTSITKIAGLLHLANKRKTEKEAKKASIINIDKVAIAKQIANALVLQGKTDVTQAELEQLINTVVQMAEASKESDKPMTTASFLEMLKQNKSQAKPEHSKQTIELEKHTKVTEIEPEKDLSSIQKDAMDGLSDLELQTLLQSFKDLSAEEQQGLISYLKKLEAKEPARVETLRKFVNMDVTLPQSSKTEEIGRISPFSKKLSENITTNKSVTNDIKKETKVGISDDEDDYSYEDVFKAASKNLSETQQSDMSNLIANIMVSIASNANTNVLTTSVAGKPVINTVPQQSVPPTLQLHPPQQQQSNSYNINSNKGFQPRQQQPYRQFQPNGPGLNARPHMQQPMGTIPHNFQGMQQRFYPNNSGGNNMDANPNQNYNYYNRW